MKFFTALLVAASVVAAQESGASFGPAVDSGSNAISAPNVNNGWQALGSVFDSSSNDGAVVAGNSGTTVSKGISNTANTNQITTNPLQSAVSGNTGLTNNGQGNQIGDLFAGGFPGGFVGGFPGSFGPHGFAKRGGYGGEPVGYGVPQPVDFPVGRPVGYPVAVPRPIPYPVAVPRPIAVPHPVAYPVGYPVARPVGYPAGYPVGYAGGHHHNQEQNASIVQNQA